METTTIRQRAPEFAGPDHECAFANNMLQLLAIPAFVLNTDCKVIIWNRACELLTGVPGYEVLGRSDHWRSFYDAPRASLAELVIQNRVDEIPRLYPRAGKHSEAGSTLSVASWCDMPRIGRLRYLAAEASPILDQHGILVAVVQTLRDMTDEKMEQIALEQLATRDALTGLANRRCFDDTLHAEWARALRQKQPLSLLMVDVDNFKAFNDANGHLGGDDCLKRIACSLSSEMRTNDLVARYGGEEFAVILPNESLKGAAIVAERIRCQVERLQVPRSRAATAGHVTVSIGAATAIASSETNASQLIGTADAALYRAKHMGRNRISLPIS